MIVYQPTYKDSKTGKIKKLNKFWVEIRDHSQIVRRFPGCNDRRATEALGRQIERLIANKIAGEQPDLNMVRWLEGVPVKLCERFAKIGLIDSGRVTTAKLLIEHIRDFKQCLLDRGDTKKQAKMTVSGIRRIMNGCKFRTWTDISASKIERYLAELREQGLSKQTTNYYLKVCKRFCKWMIQDGRATT